MKIVSTQEHYEMLIDEGNDPLQDPPQLQAYMNRWDGPSFFNELKPKNSMVLDIGIGTGRIAKTVLHAGCQFLVGIDISPKTLDRARTNLSSYPNLELVNTDVNNFIRPNIFDLAYSVLTFLHIEDKEKALNNIYISLKNNGSFVLSVSKDNEWLECGDRKIKLYPIGLEDYIRLFQSIGFQIESIQETESKYATIIKGKK
ncbi:class I SAM-dependent methyltransferase [Paenibacillus albiflavus]|uniref:Class I SAM-dependent methyltransferase n=1 Tax=Paenibacillus albiflavus TaxID=2545760 RepID=A0A4R4EJA1_9BACL|nr:class I SAM-dependent methyltransferase [Paenibacillus albiflavus]TCZ79330.1 class I SAM-dependent methyltransferase [Paenibacillus albiflavus]